MLEMPKKLKWNKKLKIDKKPELNKKLLEKPNNKLKLKKELKKVKLLLKNIELLKKKLIMMLYSPVPLEWSIKMKYMMLHKKNKLLTKLLSKLNMEKIDLILLMLKLKLTLKLHLNSLKKTKL